MMDRRDFFAPKTPRFRTNARKLIGAGKIPHRRVRARLAHLWAIYARKTDVALLCRYFVAPNRSKPQQINHSFLILAR
jgi:hypothetical protein